MRRGGVITAVTVLAAAVAIGAPGALAASPQQIYKDYADNGRLDGHYTKSDLQRALREGGRKRCGCEDSNKGEANEHAGSSEITSGRTQRAKVS